MKKISIVSGCFNEEDNVLILIERIRAVFSTLPQYDYEVIFIDNASTDGTVKKLKMVAEQDRRIKIIVNNRNFGVLRSSYHAFLQASGDAVCPMASDLQEPPELLPAFITAWESGAEVVAAVKESSEENWIIFLLRTVFYKLLNKFANIKLIEHYTGFGLYDKCVIKELRQLDDSYPFFRGLIFELGFTIAKVTFKQPERIHGRTKYRWYDLYDIAMNGLTSHSVIPMRIATIMGFTLAGLSFLVATIYLIVKLIFWSSFPLGMAPLVIGMFGMFSVQLIFIGLLGEYIGASHRQLLNRPFVIERERINFDNPPITARLRLSDLQRSIEDSSTRSTTTMSADSLSDR
ncbi:MAG: glycosyltransferase family 2 protein [Candidatus Obscuribacterales bacterium]|nr:glycosyltransferase family 2 protein [Candidatus Obscuribacterales bacterium]